MHAAGRDILNARDKDGPYASRVLDWTRSEFRRVALFRTDPNEETRQQRSGKIQIRAHHRSTSDDKKGGNGLTITWTKGKEGKWSKGKERKSKQSTCIGVEQKIAEKAGTIYIRQTTK